jgi:hypothetical protein
MLTYKKITSGHAGSICSKITGTFSKALKITGEINDLKTLLKITGGEGETSSKNQSGLKLS